MVSEIEILSTEALPAYYSDSYLIDLSPEKMKELGKQCKNRLDELKKVREDSHWEEERRKDFNAYHLQAPEIALPYRGYPNLACPLPRIGIDTFHSNVMFTFAGQSGRFKVLPDFLSNSHMDSASRAAKYMTFVMNYEAELFDALDKADLDAEKYGEGYLKALYVKKQVWETREVMTEETVPEIDEITGIVLPKTVKRKKKERLKKTVFDGVKIKRISPVCIFSSPFFENLEDAVEKDYLFEVQAYSMRQIRELSKAPKGEDAFFLPSQVKKINEAKRRQIAENFERNKQEYDGYMVDEQVELLPVELAEGHFYEDINDDGIAEKVTLVFDSDSGIVLRASYSECRIVKLCPRPIDGRWNGESIRQAIHPLTVEWEAIRNQRVAKGQWSTLPFFFYRAGGRLNAPNITLTPGKGYPMENPGDVNFPQIQGPDASYYQEERLIMDLIDRVLALGDVIQGVVGRQDSTATETIHSQQRAGIRLSTPMNRIAMALNKLVGHVWELNKQCAPSIKEFKVVGMGDGVPVFDRITNTDYEVMVSFKLQMATMYDVQMLRDSALLNYRTFVTNPMIMNHPASFYELTQKTMRDVGCEIDIPRPEQANVKSPFVEHDLIRQGEDVDPVLGENLDDHLKAHMALMRSEEFQNWPQDAQKRLMVHIDKTTIQKRTLQAAQLNQSGIYEGANMQAPSMPAFTASRNPAQAFNTMRIGETGKSERQNVKNSMKGANNNAVPAY